MATPEQERADRLDAFISRVRAALRGGADPVALAQLKLEAEQSGDPDWTRFLDLVIGQLREQTTQTKPASPGGSLFSSLTPFLGRVLAPVWKWAQSRLVIAVATLIVGVASTGYVTRPKTEQVSRADVRKAADDLDAAMSKRLEPSSGAPHPLTSEEWKEIFNQQFGQFRQ